MHKETSSSIAAAQTMSNVGWDDVTYLKKKPERDRVAKSEADVNAARRAGASVVTEEKKKPTSSSSTLDPSKAAKIDRETEDFHVEKVPLSLSKTIAQARQEKGLTQKELATKINQPHNIIAEYESGKAVNPNQQVLGKMERILGVKLRGKDIGAKLESKH
ncbi:hypothetical protein SeMB42_g05525 [Synchytrium endobioticum]|uniref:HTH cro/C1-type domain-containing protein n=1 Tax=Synchytrium endobioticum TaxID=286115 RepID=A0A507CF64_9FUNG|nr:hypothetical protein SeLEV6574_g07023 [Synchytrium endobioticum]TPX41550.1 hypothetical protein SeMB42_g05525 [Synchytrium endobioticum]